METYPYTILDSDFDLSEKPRILEAGFGDGYSQATPDGINAILQTWTWTLKDGMADKIIAIRAFLIARSGSERFYFYSPLGETIVVRCKDWGKITRGKKPGLLTIGPVVFEQVAS